MLTVTADFQYSQFVFLMMTRFQMNRIRRNDTNNLHNLNYCHGIQHRRRPSWHKTHPEINHSVVQSGVLVDSGSGLLRTKMNILHQLIPSTIKYSAIKELLFFSLQSLWTNCFHFLLRAFGRKQAKCHMCWLFLWQSNWSTLVPLRTKLLWKAALTGSNAAIWRVIPIGE